MSIAAKCTCFKSVFCVGGEGCHNENPANVFKVSTQEENKSLPIESAAEILDKQHATWFDGNGDSNVPYFTALEAMKEYAKQFRNLPNEPSIDEGCKEKTIVELIIEEFDNQEPNKIYTAQQVVDEIIKYYNLQNYRSELSIQDDEDLMKAALRNSDLPLSEQLKLKEPQPLQDDRAYPNEKIIGVKFEDRKVEIKWEDNQK